MAFSSQQLAPLLAWVAAKYAEELDPQFLATSTEDLWGRHIIWLFLLTQTEGTDPNNPEAIRTFLTNLPDDMMGAARSIFFDTIDKRRLTTV